MCLNAYPQKERKNMNQKTTDNHFPRAMSWEKDLVQDCKKPQDELKIT